MTSHCWTLQVLIEANDAGLLTDAAFASLSAKLSAVNASAGRVLTYLASQLPYTYVNLVSFVSHVYLFVLATWFGFMLSSGLNQLAVEGRGTTRLARPRLHWSPYDPVRVVNAVP